MSFLTTEELTEVMKDAYPEIDGPTEEDWDNHAIAQLEELNLDRFAALPETE